MKPLGHKAYGSIPHLPGSRLGTGEHCVNAGLNRIATERTRDKNDVVIVQEKLDGTNVAVTKINNKIIPLQRAGYVATTSKYNQHHVFAKWVESNKNRFNNLLFEGERICGEWLYEACGTKYILPHEPFVAFDLMISSKRQNYNDFIERVQRYDFITPKLVSKGNACSIEEAMNGLIVSGHGAQDKVEGGIWRIERFGLFDFITKYVRHDKEDGKYMPEKNNGIITLNEIFKS